MSAAANTSSRPGRRSQAGAATLVVVMVLFFVMAMMAAFANRNLVFEQRIASNYFRSSLAFETAEAGAEWAIAALNGGRVDAACLPSSANGDGTLRQRVMNIADNRIISRVMFLDASNNQQPISFGCVRSAANGWVCACPAGAALVPPAVAPSTQLQPMFAVTLPRTQAYIRPGVVRMTVTGCTDLTTLCANTATAATQSLGQADILLELALVSALKMPPATPLTVRGATNLGAPGLGLHNADVAAGALLLRGGGVVSGSLDRSDSVPGTPVEQAMLSEDQSLNVPAATMFTMFFGMPVAQYRDQPSVRIINCQADCSNQLTAAYQNGFRQLWIEGNLSIGTNIVLGTAADPVLIISNGALQLVGPMLITGVLYARGNASWTNGSGQPALLTGALLSEGDLSATGTADISYHSGVIHELNARTGSFVRVPGSWMDTQ